MSVEIKREKERTVRIRIRRMRIRSRCDVALAIPDLETSGSLDPDPRKVAQRWPESDRDCGSASGPIAASHFEQIFMKEKNQISKLLRNGRVAKRIG
jgi:hypothetical protein